MYPFIETIRIEQGKACNLSYNNERLNNTLHHFWPDCAGIELGEYLKLTPEMNGMKCRVIYDGGGIKEISYEGYCSVFHYDKTNYTLFLVLSV